MKTAHKDFLEQKKEKTNKTNPPHHQISTGNEVSIPTAACSLIAGITTSRTSPGAFGSHLLFGLRVCLFDSSTARIA
jgi:hypothetical protein